MEKVTQEITNEILRKTLTAEAPNGSTESLSALITTKEILDELMVNAKKNIELSGRYNAQCKVHNQQNLFKLHEIIPKFNLDEAMCKQLTFRENLVISKIDGTEFDENDGLQLTPVGGASINVSTVEGRQPMQRLMKEYEVKLLKLLDAEGLTDHMEDTSSVASSVDEDSLQTQNSYGFSKFLVHGSSQFDHEGRNGGSTLTSWVDRDLHTLEELRKEFLMDADDVPNEKSLYMALKKHWYYVKHTSSLDEIDDRKLYSVHKAKDFVSEGASIVLMRYLAIRRYYGSFELSCAYINGNLCKNIYECLGPQNDIFNGQKLDCCSIKRTIVEECGIVHKSVTVLSFFGRILKHEWSDCDYILHVNPLLKLSNYVPPSNVEEPPLVYNWTEDMQLMSQYLDRKDSCLMETKTYDFDHPDLRQIIADYVTTILQMRPSDVREFTYDYFGSFVPIYLPRNDYFE